MAPGLGQNNYPNYASGADPEIQPLHAPTFVSVYGFARPLFETGVIVITIGSNGSGLDRSALHVKQGVVHQMTPGGLCGAWCCSQPVQPGRQVSTGFASVMGPHPNTLRYSYGVFDVTLGHYRHLTSPIKVKWGVWVCAHVERRHSRKP